MACILIFVITFQDVFWLCFNSTVLKESDAEGVQSLSL